MLKELEKENHYKTIKEELEWTHTPIPHLSLQLPPSVTKQEVGEVVVVVSDIPCTIQHHQSADVGEHLRRDNNTINITPENFMITETNTWYDNINTGTAAESN